MANFNKSFHHLVQIEGWKSDHPDDPGGITYYGIAKRYWPQYYQKWGGPPNREQAGEFYRAEFWERMGLDGVHDQRVANELLEQAVHMGVPRASRFAQIAYNQVKQRDILVVDGIIGPITRRNLNRLKWADTLRWLKLMNVIQGAYYLYRTNQLDRVVEQFRTAPDDSQRTFFRGWLARVELDVSEAC